MTTAGTVAPPSREQLLHQLYEAAELEHNLMCTYLYAAFSLKDGESEGLSHEEGEAVVRWRRSIMKVAVEEMAHLTAVWNITAALGGAPRFGRDNFPLSAGLLPAGIVVKLAPFSDAVIQHFVHLERPEGSTEPEGRGFSPEVAFSRRYLVNRLTPMGVDYETVGSFYAELDGKLRSFVAHHGEGVAFSGDPALQLSSAEVALGVNPVRCSKTALDAFTAIVEQGEGAPLHSTGSHFQKFIAIRAELEGLTAKNRSFAPSFPAATNPVLRPPVVRPEGRVWLENEDAAATVDLANTAYSLMLRLLASSYGIARPSPEKALVVDLALGLMRAVTLLGERAARLPAGSSHPDCNAGMSFTTLRDAAALPSGNSARRFFRERLGELLDGARALDRGGDARTSGALRIFEDLVRRGERGFETAESAPPPPIARAASERATADPPAIGTPPEPTTVDGVEHIEGEKLTLVYDGKKCIHARFCVTGAPSVFLANVKGPWIHPDAVDVDALVEIAHMCPSGAIRYLRKDDKPNEAPPAVNLIATREAGPYAVRGDIRIDGGRPITRATLCRCGASNNKPFCDGSHHAIEFSASGEPPTTKPDMLEVRDGPLDVDPLPDGPLQVRGNLEITSGTGRVVARVVSARLCRCGGSNTKPFCDGTHARIGFKS